MVRRLEIMLYEGWLKDWGFLVWRIGLFLYICRVWDNSINKDLNVIGLNILKLLIKIRLLN